MTEQKLRAFLFFISIFFLSCQNQLDQKQYCPVTADPILTDKKNPPAMVPFVIRSDGSNLNAIIYLAQGKGPHPTVLLLHGFPGNERNLDLAQAIRRAGFNAVFFHYRGAWGSQGNFSLDHCLEDVKSALICLREDTNSINFRVDTSQIILIGHSMGGFMALRTIVDDSEIPGAVWIAGGNIAEFGRWAVQSEEKKNQVQTYLQESSVSLAGLNINDTMNDVIENQKKWDLRTHSKILATKRLLLIGAKWDEEVPNENHYIPIVESLKKHQADKLSTVVMNCDHAFSNKRIELAQHVVSWLKKNFSTNT